MMRPAEARLKASTIISSSIRLLFTGPQVDCTTKTSEPRTVSSMETEISPSAKLVTVLRPRGSPSASAISLATLALAVKILMSLPCMFILSPSLFRGRAPSTTFFFLPPGKPPEDLLFGAACAKGYFLGCFWCSFARSGRFTWRLRPMQRASSGTSSVTVVPAAV